MDILCKILEPIMNFCYNICNNYGLAIILFTLISKIVLLPVSIWVQKNSIKMVKMQPEINFIKANFYGDKDAIAEEQSKVYKREKYNAFASLIPLIIQLVLLMGLIEVIKAGMNNSNIDMSFLGVNLSLVPSKEKGWLILSPVLAGLSAWIMCITQNLSNVLQSEQSNWNKYSTMILSVGLSLYLGWFVPVGVAVYWVASNLFSVVQLYLLNWAINPKDYVDYEKLEESKTALENLSNVGEKRKIFGDPNTKRERADYKRFFSIVNKHLVFYSEGNGFYKYYRGMIEYLLENTNITIHYITSDPNDDIFQKAEEEKRIRAYFIGEKKLITMMMKMDADIVVMTMPDIENYHIKRSYIRDDIEYVYVPHGLDSINLTMRKGSVDHYDTVLCTGINQVEEIRATEKAYKLPTKKLVECGYPLLDDMISGYEKNKHNVNEKKNILIAPSWQKDNIVDSCLNEILENLKDCGCHITVRPHPQHIRHKKEQIELLKHKFENNSDIEIQTDFTSNNTVFDADLVITDWSAIAYEFAYTTKKPVLFINTPMKVMNPEYKKIDVVPLNILLRDEIGISIDLDKIDTVANAVNTLLNEKDSYSKKIEQFVGEYVYNIGCSAEVAAKYIAHSLVDKKGKKNEKNN